MAGSARKFRKIEGDKMITMIILGIACLVIGFNFGMIVGQRVQMKAREEK